MVEHHVKHANDRPSQCEYKRNHAENAQAQKAPYIAQCVGGRCTCATVSTPHRSPPPPSLTLPPLFQYVRQNWGSITTATAKQSGLMPRAKSTGSAALARRTITSAAYRSARVSPEDFGAHAACITRHSAPPAERIFLFYLLYFIIGILYIYSYVAFPTLKAPLTVPEKT